MRDAINKEVLMNAQTFVSARTIPVDESFGVMDEWVQVNMSNPGANSPAGFALLARDGNGSDTMQVGPEPFYVAGAQKFQNQSQCPLYVSTAPRREMLSSYDVGRDYPDNGFGLSTVYSGTLNLALSGSNWIYLNENLVWTQAAIGTTGADDPFGWAIAEPSRRGRYYDIEYQFESSVGTVSAYLVHRIGTARPAFPITIGPTGVTGQSGIIHVGDDTPTSPLGGYAAAGHAQASLLGSGNWTLAVTNNVAATLTGTVRVIRRGF